MANKTYRIKYNLDNSDKTIDIKMDRNFDFFEILTLKFDQSNFYQTHTSDYGVVVGRVLANDGFGIPNAKVSIFIPNNNKSDKSKVGNILYPYASVSDTNSDGVRYNLLSSTKINEFHQNVGTFPTKNDVLNNNSLIEVFDKYYKYTTTTNRYGDYMLFGVPTGYQNIHVDIDLSDIGVLSQTPRDMYYKGYSIKQFDSPTKFKKSTNLDSLPQIITENSGIFVYPFWSSDSEEDATLTKKNVNVQYKFEPTCVFMGSAFTDSEKSGLSKRCTPDKDVGKMSDLITSRGSIEMIRKTINGNIEQYPIEGNRLINSDGVWCYQIPMNLDYVMMDEYGNIVPSNSNRGIPTRTRVRFRVGLDNHGGEFNQRKTAMYLIPNNPKNENESSYEFGGATIDEDFTDLMWNKVYSVKSYIPRLQRFSTKLKNRKFVGIKSVNYSGDNNPIPYNNIWVNISFMYRLICFLNKLVINSVGLINNILVTLFKWLNDSLVPDFISVDSDMIGDCDDWDNKIRTLKENNTHIVLLNSKSNSRTRSAARYALKNKMFDNKNEFAVVSYSTTIHKLGNSSTSKSARSGYPSTNVTISDVLECSQTALSIEYEVSNFDFSNDWLNGALYLPKYINKVRKKGRRKSVKEVYCGSRTYSKLNLIRSCAIAINENGDSDKNTKSESSKYRSVGLNKSVNVDKGIINKITDEVYYYRANEIKNNKLIYKQPTDIILLGSLTKNDEDGIPQLFKHIPSTTFKIAPQQADIDEDTNDIEMTGIDWGTDDSPEGMKKGLFLALDCSSSKTVLKTCVNAMRQCELGVEYDELYNEDGFNIITDGKIGLDEIGDGNARAMFATLNINNLKTVKDKRGLFKYDFKYNDPSSFSKVNDFEGGHDKTKTDHYNYFRWGNIKPYNYNIDTYNSFLRYENSFYFYFGLKPGRTAMDLFYDQYYSHEKMEYEDKVNFSVEITQKPTMGNDDGTIRIISDVSLSNYKVTLNGSVVNISSNNIINNIGKGEHILKIEDGVGGESVIKFFMFTGDNVEFDSDIVNATHPTENNGSITISDVKTEIKGNIKSKYVLEKGGNPIKEGEIDLNQNVSISKLSVGDYVLYVYDSEYEFSKLLSTELIFTIMSTPFVLTSENYVIGYPYITYKYKIDNNGFSDIIESGVEIKKGDNNMDEAEMYPFVGGLYEGVENELILKLEPNSVYYYRAYAINEAGVSYGATLHSMTDREHVELIFNYVTNSNNLDYRIIVNNLIKPVKYGVVCGYDPLLAVNHSDTFYGNMNKINDVNSIDGVVSNEYNYIKAFVIDKDDEIYYSEIKEIGG